MIGSAFIIVTVISLLETNVLAVTQPVYDNQQYYAAPQQYLQQFQNQPQYISAPPVPQAPTPLYEGAPHQQVSQQFIPNPPTHRVSQLLLPSAADRQVQKAAEQIAGPAYAKQVQLAQQQGLADQVIATAQRRAQAQLRRAQMQQAQLAQQSAQQQQYLTEISPKQQQYFADIAAQQQQQQLQQQQIQQQQQQQYIEVPQARQQPQQQYQIQYEQEYQTTAKPSRAAAPQYRNIGQQRQEEEEHDNNSSYQFGFDVKDDLYTNYQNRKEQREGGKISGSYSVVDSDGYIRTVTYTADPKEGFKAEVVRQPTDIVVKVPKPKEVLAQEPHQQYLQEVPAQRYQPQPQQIQQQQPQQKLIYQYQ